MTTTAPTTSPRSFCCVIINEGTTASALTAQVIPAWLARCAQACATQLSRDVAPIWGSAVGFVRAGSGPTDILPGEMVFSLVDTLPNAPGAVAYHDTNGAAVPVAFLALSTCNTLDDVSSAVSHELCETAGDEGCNRWCDDNLGSEFAMELADAVESNAYPVDLDDGQPPISVSDFLLPAFFAPSSAGPYNFMAITGNPVVPTPSTSNPTSAFNTASGGYQITRTSGTNESQVTARAKYAEGVGKTLAEGRPVVVGTPRTHRAEHIGHWSSRSSRRGAKLAA